MDELVSVHQTHLGLPTVGMEAVLTIALATPSAPECGDVAVDFACRGASDDGASMHPSDETVLAAFGATLVDEGRLDPSVRCFLRRQLSNACPSTSVVPPAPHVPSCPWLRRWVGAAVTWNPRLTCQRSLLAFVGHQCYRTAAVVTRFSCGPARWEASAIGARASTARSTQ